MNAYAYQAGNFSRRFEEVMDNVSAEVRESIAYVDAVIVPEIRQESSAALRKLAGHLERLADRLHQGNGSGQQQS